MRNSRLTACGALALAIFILSPSLSADDSADAAGKKRRFWNRLRHAEAQTQTAAAPSAEASDAVPATVNVAEPPATGAAAPAAPSAPAASPAAAGTPAAAPEPTAPALPKPRPVTSGSHEINRVVASLRAGPIGSDTAAIPYLDLIEAGEATAAELNDFAAYVSRKGRVDDACAIQRRATEIDDKNSMLWLNLGTLERGARRSGPAARAYKRAVELDPANALAWYGLGVVQDTEHDYDASVESFRRALTLDPTLADPRVNPQVVDNERLLVVRLMLGQQRSGALGLPLVPMQKAPEAAAAPDAAPAPDPGPKAAAGDVAPDAAPAKK